MKKYINTSNYYLSTTASIIDSDSDTGTIDISEISIDGVTLPLEGYYRVDVDFSDSDKREIFRISKREGYTLTYDKRISPNDKQKHSSGASIALRDFSELFNSLSKNSDNFGEVEQVGDDTIKIFGGKAFVSGKGYYDISTTTKEITLDTTKYIEYNTTNNTFDVVDNYNVNNYLLAKVVSNSSTITSIYDLRGVLVNGGGIGDMLKSTYDPNSKESDAFDMDNMTQGDTNKYVSTSDISTWNAKQEALVSGSNIKTINGYNILGEGNLTINSTFNGTWEYETTENGVSSYTLTHTPLNDKAFMVFVDSGTGMFPTTDYTYNSTTKTITFTFSLASNEHAIIWVMQDGFSPAPTIGQATITLTKNGSTLDTFNVNTTTDKTINLGTVGDGVVTFKKGTTTVGTFSANATGNTEIQVGGDAGEGDITIKQAGTTKGTFNVNTNVDKDININGDIFVTEDEYEDLPTTKLTDGNNYFIYYEE